MSDQEDSSNERRAGGEDDGEDGEVHPFYEGEMESFSDDDDFDDDEEEEEKEEEEGGRGLHESEVTSSDSSSDSDSDLDDNGAVPPLPSRSPLPSSPSASSSHSSPSGSHRASKNASPPQPARPAPAAATTAAPATRAGLRASTIGPSAGRGRGRAPGGAAAPAPEQNKANPSVRAMWSQRDSLGGDGGSPEKSAHPGKASTSKKDVLANTPFGTVADLARNFTAERDLHDEVQGKDAVKDSAAPRKRVDTSFLEHKILSGGGAPPARRAAASDAPDALPSSSSTSLPTSTSLTPVEDPAEPAGPAASARPTAPARARDTPKRAVSSAHLRDGKAQGDRVERAVAAAAAAEPAVQAAPSASRSRRGAVSTTASYPNPSALAASSSAATGGLGSVSHPTLPTRTASLASVREGDADGRRVVFEQQEDGALVVVAGSLDGLLWTLLDGPSAAERARHKKAHFDLESYRDMFFSTLGCFSSPEVIMQGLVSMFDLSAAPPDKKGKVKVSPTQERVIDVLMRWAERFPHELEVQIDTRRLFVKWYRRLLKSRDKGKKKKKSKGKAPKDLARLAELSERFQRMITYTMQGAQEFYDAHAAPNAAEDGGGAELFAAKLLKEVKAKDMAQQITLAEHKVFRSIRLTELQRQCWVKHKEDAVNVLHLIRRFNELSYWIMSQILFAPDEKQRVSVLSKFIKVAKELLALNNFNGVMLVLSAINNSAVQRLKDTWDAIKPANRKLYEQVQEVFDAEGNFAPYRKSLESCQPPAIPFMGIFLSGLTFIDENPDTKDGLINFQKFIYLGKEYLRVKTFQDALYNIKADDAVLAFFLGHRTDTIKKPYPAMCWVTDKELYTQSTRVRPRPGQSSVADSSDDSSGPPTPSHSNHAHSNSTPGPDGSPESPNARDTRRLERVKSDSRVAQRAQLQPRGDAVTGLAPEKAKSTKLSRREARADVICSSAPAATASPEPEEEKVRSPKSPKSKGSSKSERGERVEKSEKAEKAEKTEEASNGKEAAASSERAVDFTMVALGDYTAQSDAEVSFRKGSEIRVTRVDRDKGVCYGTVGKRAGYFPAYLARRNKK